MVSYCAFHSTPDPDNVLVVKTPEGVFSTKFLLQSSEKQTATRLVRKENHPEKVLPAKISDCPAARCLTYEMLKNKKEPQEAIAHRIMGPQQHSQDLIEALNTCMDHNDDQLFSTFKERLCYLQKTENKRVSCGLSGIHGWGLFAARKIQEGQMVYHVKSNFLC
ncbi:histone-lysine N-methyltransferase ATX4-like [Phragmites australis]|uniref:histone-lysine N-methyltransferase ATX4-like n=1 Tax=Phragmites australis TaxID=29695 RepID=UPI002D7A07DE|nr:histone-lysine N-methyltransferase ATX4-like [Phragmites australis]